MAMNFSDSGITFADGSVQPTALTTGTQTIAGAKTFSSNVTLSAGVQGALVLGTAQNTTSGTSIDFTSIPSWAKRITVMFNGVSVSGTSLMQVQLGSGSVTTSGYNSAGSTNGATSALLTSGLLANGRGTATTAIRGLLTITNVSGNTWVMSGVTGAFDSTPNYDTWSVAGSIALGGALDRLRLTTVNGTDTFDAGSVNIMYEG